ncbi:7093_t:CDS:2, partial [Entrophospora sp. SA101]
MSFLSMFNNANHLLFLLLLPLSFDLGGPATGLALSFALFLYYIVLGFAKIMWQKKHGFGWAMTQILIWAQPVLIPFFMIHSVRLTYILIEEQQNSQYNGPKFKLPLVLNVYQGLLSCSAPIFTLVEAIATSMLILEIRRMDILSATLIGSVLTLAITISIVCLIFNKGSIVDISLLFAYTIYCIYMLSLNWKDDGTKLKGGYRTDSTMPIFEDLKPLPLLIYLDFDLMDFINLFYNLNFHILLKKFSELIFNFKYVSVIEKAFSLNMFVSLIYRTVIISKLLYSVQMQEKNDEFDIEEEHL